MHKAHAGQMLKHLRSRFQHKHTIKAMQLHFTAMNSETEIKHAS